MSSPTEHTPTRRTPHADGSGPPAERLPAGFESSLRAVDAALAEHFGAMAEDVPDGLADRVYQVSVGEVPGRAVLPPRRQVLPLIDVFRLPVTEPWRGRLAMAASLVITVSLAMMFYTRQREIEPEGSRIAVHEIDLDWLDESPLDAVDAEIGYLLDTGELNSHEELADELEQILADLG